MTYTPATTAAQLLTAIQTVDGTGSGLDADLLDGLNSTAFDAAGVAVSTVTAHEADTTAVHGIADTTTLVLTADSRLTNARTPTAHATTHVGGGTDAIATAIAAGAAGLMSGTDKTKLDGIEALATNDMTAAEILTAIKTVDGTGSGLDADLLDGLSSAYFAVATRVATLVDAATVTPATDLFDVGKLASLSQTTTFANPTGTPVDFQQYIIRITSTLVQTLLWGSQYRGSVDLSLPSVTSGAAKSDYFAFRWHATDSKWDLLALNRAF